jgi:hypothetical protein
LSGWFLLFPTGAVEGARHKQGILTVVSVVAPTSTGYRKASLAIQRLGAKIALSNLKVNLCATMMQKPVFSPQE